MTTDGSLVALFHTPNIYSRSNSPSAGHLSTCLDFRLRLRGHFGWHGLSTVLQQWQHPALGAQSYQGAGADWADAATFTVFRVAVLDAFGGMFAGQLLPSGNWTVCYWKWPFSSLIYPWKRLWFSIISYVSSPEGSWEQCFAGRWRCSLFLNLTPWPFLKWWMVVNVSQKGCESVGEDDSFRAAMGIPTGCTMPLLSDSNTTKPPQKVPKNRIQYLMIPSGNLT